MTKRCQKSCSQTGWCNKPTKLHFQSILNTEILMLSKRYESTEVDRRTWLHVPAGTHWSISSDTHQEVEIQIETSTKSFFIKTINTFVKWVCFVFRHKIRISFTGVESWRDLTCRLPTEWPCYTLLYRKLQMWSFDLQLDYIHSKYTPELPGLLYCFQLILKHWCIRVWLCQPVRCANKW